MRQLLRKSEHLLEPLARDLHVGTQPTRPELDVANGASGRDDPRQRADGGIPRA